MSCISVKPKVIPRDPNQHGIMFCPAFCSMDRFGCIRTKVIPRDRNSLLSEMCACVILLSHPAWLYFKPVTVLCVCSLLALPVMTVPRKGYLGIWNYLETIEDSSHVNHESVSFCIYAPCIAYLTGCGCYSDTSRGSINKFIPRELLAALIFSCTSFHGVIPI